ncbi:hypothetical protein ABBQ32_14193 [Trebouxia sp. C0010 RCD-2024]
MGLCSSVSGKVNTGSRCLLDRYSSICRAFTSAARGCDKVNPMEVVWARHAVPVLSQAWVVLGMIRRRQAVGARSRRRHNCKRKLAVSCQKGEQSARLPATMTGAFNSIDPEAARRYTNP